MDLEAEAVRLVITLLVSMVSGFSLGTCWKWILFARG